MVYTDRRIPEIARIIKLQGAQLILDTENLVSSAETPSLLTNQQYKFMLRERAKENSLFIAVCDKCGVEDASVTMIGRSMVISPKGEIISECNPSDEQILTCEIDLSEAGGLINREPAEYSVKPDGGSIATTFRVLKHSVFTMIFTAISRSKTVVPRTDILTTRHPKAYERLTE